MCSHTHVACRFLWLGCISHDAIWALIFPSFFISHHNIECTLSLVLRSLNVRTIHRCSLTSQHMPRFTPFKLCKALNYVTAMLDMPRGTYVVDLITSKTCHIDCKPNCDFAYRNQRIRHTFSWVRSQTHVCTPKLAKHTGSKFPHLSCVSRLDFRVAGRGTMSKPLYMRASHHAKSKKFYVISFPVLCRR